MPKTKILAEDEMRKLGFTDRCPSRWYFCKRVIDNQSWLTLNITIDKLTGEWTEYVLDENFLQPYYYGKYGRGHYAKNIDKLIKPLNDSGLGVYVDHRLYGVER